VVSQPCFQALTAWGLTAVNAFKICLPDVLQLCPQVPPRSGYALNCLLQNADKLSPRCRASLVEQDLLDNGDGGADPGRNGSGEPPRRP
jgi:hypothetical protein